MTKSLTIQCPQCSSEFPLSGDLLTSVRAEVSNKLTAKIKKQEEINTAESIRLQHHADQLANQKLEQQKLIQHAVQEQVAQREAKLAEEKNRLHTVQQKIDTAKSTLKAQIEQGAQALLKTKEQELRKEESQKAKNLAAIEIANANRELLEKDKALKLAQEKELEFISQKRQLDQERQAFQLKVARTVEEQRLQIQKETLQQADQESQLKIAEKDKTILDLQNKLKDAARQAEQGSQQHQGEVFEREFENSLLHAFPTDKVAPVPTGTTGADIALFVANRQGQTLGQILFENKRTKAFSKLWIAKLRKDMQIAKADLGVIVTQALPDSIQSFGQIEGIWICDYSSALPLIATLRSMITEVSLARGVKEGAKEKSEMLYEYITGNEFRQRVELIAKGFTTLQAELNKERNYMMKQWAKRETQMHQVLDNLTGMTGQMQALTQSNSLNLLLEDDVDENDTVSS